jgi:tetratricopeptide (TPR) repeat protein
VRDNYRRCLLLSIPPVTSPDEAPATQAFEILWGLQGCHAVRGEMREALAIGEIAITVADASAQQNPPGRLHEEHGLLAHRMQGLARLQAGEIAAAIRHYQQVERRYNPASHQGMRFRYASDQGVLAQAHWAWAEAVSGNLAASEWLAGQALARAGQLDHPHTSAHVVSVLAARAQTLQQREVAAPLALAARTLSHAHGFTYWAAWAEIILGWHEGARAPEDGIGRIERAIQDYRRTGAGQALPYAMLLKAEVALGAGLWDLAARTTAEGIEVARRSGLGLYLGELLRVRALALRQGGSSSSEVSAVLTEAMSICAGQGTRTFAIRAAMAQLQPPDAAAADRGQAKLDRLAHARAVLGQSLAEISMTGGHHALAMSSELRAAAQLSGA